MSAHPQQPHAAGYRDRLAHLVTDNLSLIEQKARPRLRGTPFTADDVCSKILFDVAKGEGWFWRMWTENNGSFSDPSAAVVHAAQDAIQSLIRDWTRALARRGDLDGCAAAASTPAADPGAWADQYGDRQRILDAVRAAGLTEGEACIALARLDDVPGEEADRRLARVLGRGDPGEMTKSDLGKFRERRRRIQSMAYKKLRWYLDGEGGHRHE